MRAAVHLREVSQCIALGYEAIPEACCLLFVPVCRCVGAELPTIAKMAVGIGPARCIAI
jgi:hypothetical protein